MSSRSPHPLEQVLSTLRCLSCDLRMSEEISISASQVDWCCNVVSQAIDHAKVLPPKAPSTVTKDTLLKAMTDVVSETKIDFCNLVLDWMDRYQCSVVFPTRATSLSSGRILVSVDRARTEGLITKRLAVRWRNQLGGGESLVSEFQAEDLATILSSLDI